MGRPSAARTTLHPRTEEGDERWALGQAERALLANKSGATRLGFAVLLKMFQAEGRFPRRGEDVPAAAVEAIARQVGVPAVEWRRYAWGGRTAEYHRAQIRGALGFREATLEDADALGRWLEGEIFAHDRRTDRLVLAARERCRGLRIEPPSPERLNRLVRSAVHRHDDAFGAALLARLPAETAARLDALLHAPAPDGAEDAGRAPLLALRAGPGRASLQSVAEEVSKLAPCEPLRCLSVCPRACQPRCSSPTDGVSPPRSCMSCGATRRRGRPCSPPSATCAAARSPIRSSIS